MIGVEDPCCWVVFRLPEATAFVPVPDEVAVHGLEVMVDYARSMLARSSYRGAPVDEWPVTHTRFCTRADLHRGAFRRARAK